MNLLTISGTVAVVTFGIAGVVIFGIAGVESFSVIIFEIVKAVGSFGRFMLVSSMRLVFVAVMGLQV